MQSNSLKQPVRIVLADDHDLVRSGIASLLSLIKGVDVIAQASNGAELISLVEHLHPDLVMTDIGMPGIDGLTAIASLHASHPEIPLLVLSMYDTVDFVKKAVTNGACGYLIKNAPLYELEQAVLSVMASGSYFSPAIARALLQPADPTAADVLTERQIEILKLIARGKASKEIAFELGLSSKTVDVHRARIMERLGLNDIASLTLYAVRMGLVEP
jgi:DNA-binding NarL/FixJ family response regulator